VVLKRSVEPGQTVAASLQAPILFTLAEDLKQMELKVDVDEADIGRVKPGQAATFGVDAYPDKRFPATIEDVYFASEVVQGVVTYKAILAVDNSELLLRPGMTATAEITVEQVAQALLLPNAALRFTPPSDNGQQGDTRSFLQRIIGGMPRFRPPSVPEERGPKRTVYVLKDGAPSPVVISIGSSDGKHTVLTEAPLKAGEAVIVDTNAKAK
jgi:HlyD family secretion protein